MTAIGTPGASVVERADEMLRAPARLSKYHAANEGPAAAPTVPVPTPDAVPHARYSLIFRRKIDLAEADVRPYHKMRPSLRDGAGCTALLFNRGQRFSQYRGHTSFTAVMFSLHFRFLLIEATCQFISRISFQTRLHSHHHSHL